MWRNVVRCGFLLSLQVPHCSAANLLEGTPLVNVSKQKYLGVTVDSNLTWALMFARK